MKFTVTRENLQQALGAVTRSTPARTTLPVLANILLTAEEGWLTLSGTDLDTAVVLRVPAEVTGPGAITAPAKKLQEIARELPAAVEVSTAGDAIKVASGRSRFKLNGLPRDEFPALPKVSFQDCWKTTGGVLRELISRVAFAASTEETRPILNGVLWRLTEGAMQMVATNGHRLSKRVLPVESAAGAPTCDLIVHPKALALVGQLFPDDAEVEVARTENHLGFRTADVQLYTRLIEGPYPNYEQVIPKDNDKTLVADRAALNAAVRRAAIVASDQTHRIRLALGGPTLTITVQTPDLGESHEEVPVEYQGDPIEIGFNAQYLLELFRHMSTEEVRMTFKAPERAATIEPVQDRTDDNDSMLTLCMPLRLLG